MLNITAIKQKFTIRTTILVVTVVVSILSMSAAVMAWGPNRQTFTMQNPATYVTFNSITNNQNFGDERNFFRVRDVQSSAAMDFDDKVTLAAGKEYEAVVFFHNNAASDLNASGTGIAHGAYAKAQMPAIVSAHATNENAEAFVGASNANPTSVYDYIEFANPSNVDMALRIEPGTVKFQSFGPHDGDKLSDTTLFSDAGQPLGFDQLDGTLPGCDHYSGYITYRFVAIQPDFKFTKDVRLSGTKAWADKVSAAAGATVEYMLTYQNTGTTEQDKVVLKDVLPAGLKYVAGSSKLYTTATPDGKPLTDGIGSGGMEIGSYNPGAGSYLTFAATVKGDPCTSLVNTAYAQTQNGNLQDTATVTVAGSCKLPTTGPVEIISGLLGVGAITAGVVYFFISRRQLESKLIDVQSHPISHIQHHDEHKK